MSETLFPSNQPNIKQIGEMDPFEQAEALKNAFPENRPEVLADFLRKHAGNMSDLTSLLPNSVLPNLTMGNLEP